METLALISSPKPLLTFSHSKDVFLLSSKSSFSPLIIKTSSLSPFSRSFTTTACSRNSNQPSIHNIKVVKRVRNDCFASIFSRSNQTPSVAVDPQPTTVPPPASNFGSPLFWIGVGVGFSALFSWVASSLKKYAMQQAFKTMMGSQNSQYNAAGFSPPGSPFPFPTPPPGPAMSPTFPTYPSPGTATSPPFPTYPPSQSESVSPTPSTSASRSVVNVDPSPTKVEDPSAAHVDENSDDEKPKKNAFVDVSPEETLQKSPFAGFDQTTTSDLPKNTDLYRQVKPNGSASGATGFDTYGGSSSFDKKSSGMSVEALEKMMEDPTVQKMVYPYLPEEMRNPTTFKWMMQNPQYRKQLEDMLNNMGGNNTEWDNRMMDSLKNFDLSSPEVKQQFDQIGLTPEEVISKIMANPDVAMAFQNPRVQAAIMDCSQNPLSIAKYQNDKEVMDVFNKISELFPGATGGP